ncbi:MAG: transketolase [Firmicutes bacterium]|jgi:transketolase|nr:transketolase [Bacillota bacterium]HQD39178.1 transketolase [Bacillota bacterium]
MKQDLGLVAQRVRGHVVEMIGKARSGHPGGSLSATDILTFLYFQKMNIDPQNPHWEKRDRFVLSKGHAAPALYAVLAERGFFPTEELLGLRQFGSRLQGHPDCLKTPGVDASTGSLGQGLSIANGLALAARLNGESWRTYVLMGDGELEEGQIWEAAMTTVHYNLTNLTAIVDHNKLQIDGQISDVKLKGSIAERFRAFGWHTVEIDGHDFSAIEQAFDQAEQAAVPTVIVAHTIKGRGVSFMENQANWHGSAPGAEQVEAALRELGREC